MNLPIAKRVNLLPLFLMLLGSFSILKAQDFPNALPIPYEIDSDTVLLEMSEQMHSFNPGDPDHYLFAPIRAFAFNEVGAENPMTILGPTIAWNFGASLHNEVTNSIDRVSTTHWHGAHVPPHADGGPHQKIQVGDTWKVDFDVLDKSATMWYHPHAIDITYEQVQMGLSGMIYVEDPADGVGDDPTLNFIHDITPHDYGKDDFPIIIQTKIFDFDSTSMMYQIRDQQGFKKDYEYLVNGVMNPYLEVPANMIRLRVLNGDGKFTFNLGVGDKNFNPANSFNGGINLIATDAGYTDRSYYKESLYMAPGERTEWLLDMRGKQGDTLYIYNKVSGFPNDGSIIGDQPTTQQYAQDKLLLRLVVGAPNNELPISPIIGFPIPLDGSPDKPTVHPWTKKRIKTFYQSTEVSNCDSSWTLPPNGIYTIDHTPMDLSCINDTIMLDSTEVWEVVNSTDRGHPFHIHDIHFWVIDGWNNVTGDPIDQSLWPEVFKGPKDNVYVQKNWTLQVATTFKDFGTAIDTSNSYMFHCHILPHEDKGMMGQFVVWDGSTVVDVPPALKSSEPLKLFPNPATERLYLEGSSDQESQIRIFNLQGQLLVQRKLAPFEGQTDFSISELPRGMIFVEWLTDEGRFVGKVQVY